MNINVGKSGLLKLVHLQITNLFSAQQTEKNVIRSSFDEALRRTETCFSRSDDSKYYRVNDAVIFNAFHSGQYCIFLYFLSNEVWKSDARASLVADKIYYLNKALNGLDLFYQVEMPAIFSLDHPVGSVIGRAKFGDGFRFSQNCTVGNNHGVYPRLGRNVVMHSGSKIIGKCSIGDNVVLSANSYVKDQDIPSNSVVFGTSPGLIVKKLRKSG